MGAREDGDAEEAESSTRTTRGLSPRLSKSRDLVFVCGRGLCEGGDEAPSIGGPMVSAVRIGDAPHTTKATK